MKKIFAILIALSALSNFSCKEKEEEYTEGGLVFGGIYMLDGQQLVETDGYILELPAEQNTVELRIVSKGVQEFGIGGYPMSGSSRTFQTIGWSGVNSPSGRRADKGKRSLTTPFFMLQTDRSRPFRRIFSPSSHLGRARASAALHPP